MVERANKEVVRHLRTFLAVERRLDGWHKKIRQVQRIINGAVHHTLGVSPATVMYGGLVDYGKGVFTTLPQGEAEDVDTSEWLEDQMQFQIELQENLKESLKKIDAAHLAKRSGEVTEYEVGSLVLASYPKGRFNQGPPQKLKPLWRGPMRVKSVVHDIYTLEDLNHASKVMRVHVSRLCQFKYDETQVIPAEIALTDNEEFIVERICGHSPRNMNYQTAKKRIWFEVKWEGYDHESNTQEPWANLRNNAVLHAYLREIKRESMIPKEYR